jgi:hypothetical protein
LFQLLARGHEELNNECALFRS